MALDQLLFKTKFSFVDETQPKAEIYIKYDLRFLFHHLPISFIWQGGWLKIKDKKGDPIYFTLECTVLHLFHSIMM